LETAKDVEKAFLNLNSAINSAASAITPKPTIRRNKPKLQVMSEEILKAIKNKKDCILKLENKCAKKGHP
jgi:hypothetical protein